MKKTIGILIMTLLAFGLAVSCSKDDDVFINVESVELDKTELEILVGETYVLVANILPENASNKNVSWKSSNISIASVDQNGEVTALRTGKTTITVTTEDGYKTASAEVNVKYVYVPVTGVSIDKSELKLAVGQSETLVATVSPANATNDKVYWSSSDTSVASVDQNGKVTALAKGNCKISVRTEDSGDQAFVNLSVVEPKENFEHNGIYYKAITPGSTELMVINPSGSNSYSRHINVPGVVDYEGISYTVEKINFNAFKGSENLLTVKLGEGIKVIGASAFDNCINLTNIELPASLNVINAGNTFFLGNKKLSIQVASGNPNFFVENEALYEKFDDGDISLRWIPEKLTGAFTIKSTTVQMGSYASTSCSLTTLSIPASVKWIKYFNFSKAFNLKKLELYWTAQELAELTLDKRTTTYFQDLTYSDITLVVPAGTKAAYQAHPLWGLGFKIAER